MLTVARARTIALSFPEAKETPHHGIPSFRVREKIFATFYEDGIMNVMLDPFGIKQAVRKHPRACEEGYWGTKLAVVKVILAHANETMLRALLAEAWSRKAPAALAREKSTGNSVRARKSSARKKKPRSKA